jgi:hypothetical protein
MSSRENSNLPILQLKPKLSRAPRNKLHLSLCHHLRRYPFAIQHVSTQPLRGTQYRQPSRRTLCYTFEGDVEWDRGSGVVDCSLEGVIPFSGDPSYPVCGPKWGV